MKIVSILYSFILALWVGGIFIFTFLVTPVIFQSFGRDTAGDIVSKLFPYYFPYNLFLSVLALIIFALFFMARGNLERKITMILLVIAVVTNLLITFKIYPDIKRTKQQITTFETGSNEPTLRRNFTKLHTVSAMLNILLLMDGTVLLILNHISKNNVK